MRILLFKMFDKFQLFIVVWPTLWFGQFFGAYIRAAAEAYFSKKNYALAGGLLVLITEPVIAEFFVEAGMPYS